MKRKRLFIIIGAILVVVIIIVVNLNQGDSGEKVDVSLVKRGKITSVVTASGPFSPKRYSVADGILSPTLIVISNSHALIDVCSGADAPLLETHKPSMEVRQP